MLYNIKVYFLHSFPFNLNQEEAMGHTSARAHEPCALRIDVVI